VVKAQDPLGGRIVVQLATDQTGSQNLNIINGDGQFPFLGGFGTGASLTTGSPAFVILGDVQETPAGAPPVPGEDGFAESAIWRFNADNGTVTINPFWVNKDGSSPKTTSVGFFNGSFILTGDSAAFDKAYPQQAEWVTFTLTEPEDS